MTYRFRQSMTVCLGLLAMWLIVFAPLISQLVVAARQAALPIAQDSSVSAPGQASKSMAMDMHMHAHMHMAMPAATPMHMTMPMPAGMHHDPSKMLEACGYCDLLADHMVLPSIPPTIPTVTAFVMVATIATLSTRFTPLGAFPSGRPRGPPASSLVSL